MYREILKDLIPYKPGKSVEDIKREYNLNDITKLASNENPYACSSKVLKVLSEPINIEIYPDNNCTNLRKELANKLNVEQENLVFGSGSTEVISMISRAALSTNDEILTCTPTFPIYESEAIIANAKCVKIPLQNHKFDLYRLLENITDKTKIIYIANPNNPTGTIIRKEEQIDFLNKVPKDIFVVLDEAYYEYVTDENYPDSIGILNQYPNLIILRTFSKVYGLASLRVGYGIASKEVITNLEKVRNPFNVTTMSMNAVTKALQDTEFVENAIRNNRKALEEMYIKLNKLNISYIETQANFIMIDVKKDGKIAFEELLKKGFIVRPGFSRNG